MQPTFNPWIGYFDLINYVDKFVFLDNVQLVKRSWQVRNKLKIDNKEYMFSIPIKKTNSRDKTILKDAEISYENFDFRNKLKNLLLRNYKKAKYFEELENRVFDIISFQTNSLSLYNINFIREISSLLGYEDKFICSSSLKDIQGLKSDLILSICKKLSCLEYISPIGSKVYLDENIESFACEDIDVFYQDYSHKTYSQIGDEFIPYLGILDVLFNEGINKTKEIIIGGRNFIKEYK